MTDHFSSEEFESKDGTKYPEEWFLYRLKPLCCVLEKIRALTNQPLFISSGYRSRVYNAALYRKMGKPTTTKSMHCEGLAADIHLTGMTANQLHIAIEHLIEKKVIPNGGVGVYPTFVHYDLRGLLNLPAARWEQTA